jgi:peptide subunit release factor 1 (eRF1)
MGEEAMTPERTIALLTEILIETRDSLAQKCRTVDYLLEKERRNEQREIYVCPHCGNCDETDPGKEPECSAECHPTARMVPIRRELVRLRTLLGSRANARTTALLEKAADIIERAT